MKFRSHFLVTLSLMVLSYVAGTQQWLAPVAMLAQEGGVSKDAKSKIQEANAKLDAAKAQLEADGSYKSIMLATNVSAVMAGGVDSQKDLEDGRGVDPETFGALYAGEVTVDIKEKLSFDEEGRLLYNNKIVRLWPKSRLKKMYADRRSAINEREEKKSK